MNDHAEDVVVFKCEDDLNGEPFGPLAVRPKPTESQRGSREEIGVPFVPKCVCERPEGQPGRHCRCCSREIGESWVTLAEAEAKARELGLALVVS